MYRSETLIEYGDKLTDLWDGIAEWSQKTFGTDAERGPVGPLKHLALEVQEALANPKDREEFADLLILVFDSARRAGLSLADLLRVAQAKHEKNRKRTWPKPTNDEPVEHVREGV